MNVVSPSLSFSHSEYLMVQFNASSTLTKHLSHTVALTFFFNFLFYIGV